MRIALVLAVALGFALVAPATALGAAPGVTSLSDTAIAYYLSPDQSQCLVLTLAWVAQRPADGELSYSQHLDVQLSGPTCQPSATSNGVDLGASDYRIVGLTNAYVETSLDVAGHPVSVDVAWTATGAPRIYSDQFPDNTVVVARDVGAHLTGTVTVDGAAWTANQQTALLRSGTWTTFAAAPAPPTAAQPSSPGRPSTTLPPTTTAPAETGRGDGSLVGVLALLLLGAGAVTASSVAWGSRGSR